MLVYQFHSELEDYHPKIWRRFQTAGNISLARLGYIVMTMYEMKGQHLLELEYEKPFITASGRYSSRMELLCRYALPPAMDEDAGPCKNAATAKISKLDLEPPHRLLVNYDFGDGWAVDLKLEEKIEIPDLTAKDLPRVLTGKGWGIVEDCGGVPALEELAQAFKQKKGETYENLRDWLGVDDFDMEKFDVDEMNFRLKKLPAIFANIYEKKKMPTNKQIDLIERNFQRFAQKDDEG